MFGKLSLLRPFHSLLLASTLLTSFAWAKSASSTILVFARDTASSYSVTSGLNAHGIPYQLLIVPSTGVTLPTLSSSATTGNFGGFLILSEVAYGYDDGSWRSALTDAQLQSLYTYQTTFGVRMVRLDVYPSSDFGVKTYIDGSGCCDAGVEQLVSISNSTGFPTANMKIGAGITTEGLWHYPAVVTNSSMAWEIAQFAPAGHFQDTTTAAVINKIGTRQQMVWFTSWATDWSPASNFLQHAYINWMTRGMYVGRRRIYFNTQIDDVGLATVLYSPANTAFRLRPTDLMAHTSWMTSLNARLPAGSQYFIELAHNGNGDILNSIIQDNSTICNPISNIQYTSLPATDLEFQKPLGSGTNLWPTTPTSYTWTLACAILDPLIAWIRVPANRDAYAHLSHTFSHESLNNATSSDVKKEITFNADFMKQIGLTTATKFSPKGLVPPAITGLHNGDALSTMVANGITSVVGDNTRPVLMNSVNEYWPIISSTAANGYTGMVIMPRWATSIYYNCDLPDCTLTEWIATSGGSGDFSALLDNARSTNIRHLLGLRHDGYMFHQANLRQADVTTQTIGTQTGQFSLLQCWVETVLQELTRLTTWPIISLKHDDMAVQFTNRMTLDACKPTLTFTYASDSKTITAVTVGATSNKCGVTVPVTLPVAPKNLPSGATSEKVGSDSNTIWVKLSGSAVSITLATAVAV